MNQCDRTGDALAGYLWQQPTLVPTPPDMAYRFRNDHHRTMEFVTEGVRAITGFRPADFAAGRTHWAQLAQLEGFDWLAETGRQARTGLPFRLEYRIRHRDGSQRWVSEQGQGIFDEANTLIAFEGFVTILAGRPQSDRDGAAAEPPLALPNLDRTERKRTAQPLAENEGGYRTLLEALPTAVYACDTQGRLIFFNEQAVALWGQRPRLGDEDHVFCGSVRLWRPDGQPLPHDRTAMSDAARTGARFRNEEVLIEQPDGRRVRVLVNIDPLRDAEGRVIGAINSFSDISAQRQAEDALRNSEERLLRVCRAGRIGLYEWRPSRDDAYWSPEAYELFGLDPQAPANYERWIGSVHPDDRENAERNLAELLKQGIAAAGDGAYRHEYRVVHADGSVLWLEAMTAFALDGDELVIQGAVHDISEQKRIAAALRESQERLHLALDAANLTSFDWDIQRNEVRHAASTNSPLAAMLEQMPSTFEAVCTVVHPEDRDRFAANVLAALERADGHYENEFRIVHPDGTIVWLSERGRVECDAPGRPVRLIGLSQDITARKQVEEALRQRERELQTLTDHAPDIIGRVDRQLRHVFVSRAIARITGKSIEEYLGKTNEELGYPPDLCACWSAHFREVFRTGQPRELEFDFTSPQGPIHFSQRAVPEFGPDGAVDAVVFVTRDVTRLKRAEERARLALEAGQMATWDLFVVDNASAWNEAHYRMLGYRAGEVTPGYRAWAERVHPDDLPEIASRFQRSLNEGGDFVGDYRVIWPDGTCRWLEARGRTECDLSGQPVRSFGVMLDITPRKQAEEALRESDRRKNEFLAILAHELRNPLAPIRNAVEILRLADPTAAKHTALDMIDRQLRHLVRLIDDLLDVSRITRGKLRLCRERVELSKLLEQVLETARPQVERAGHLLTMALPLEPIELDADPVRLAQVFLNLLDNACKYTEKGGRIRLSARREGSGVVVEVADSGIGIPPGYLPGLFDLFAQVSTASEASRDGLGIGLSLARGLVDLHGGRIDASSRGLGHGSAFSVHLPVVSTPPAAAPSPPEPQARGPATPLHVLVVDDNRDIAESLAILLQAKGYTVTTASDGLAAIKAAAHDRPAVVLLDLGMPKLDGYDTCRRLRTETWGQAMRIVALTGWGQAEDRRKTREAGFDGHLVKPVELSALLRLLADTPAIAPSRAIGAAPETGS